jgi:hypothetical protein
MSNLDSGLDRDVESGRALTGPIESAVAPGDEPSAAPAVAAAPPIDLDLIERDLRDVETTLARLADGTYFAQGRASVPGTDARPSPTDSRPGP